MTPAARMTIAGLACLAAATAVAHAQGEPAIPSLTCAFKAGAAWSYAGGEYTSVEPQPLTFDIEAVDLELQTARLSVGGKAAGNPLRVVRALNANHFLEVAQEGFLNVTTIYDVDPATGSRPAIHSRHLGLLGQPVFSQYAGFCTAK